MEDEPDQRRSGKRMGPRFRKMVFSWRIRAYQPRRRLRTAAHADTQRQIMPLLSPLHKYRMSNDTLRLDPLASLPVPADSSVQQTVDYFFQVLSPIRNVPLSVEGHPDPGLSIGFPISLRSTMCFEARVAMWRSLWLTVMRKPLEQDSFLFYHKGNALRLLQQRLRCNPNLVDEDVMMTIVDLGYIEIFLDNTEGVKAHLNGIQQLRRMRRAWKDDSPLGQYLTGRTNNVEKVARITMRDINSDSSNLTGSPRMVLTYPRHPFPANLSQSLSTLPDGFIEVALSGSLSFEMINFLTRFMRAKGKPGLHQLDTREKVWKLSQITIDMIASFPTPGMTHVENYLFYGLFALALQLDEEKLHPVNQARGVRALLKPFAELQISRPVSHKECVIWNHFSFAGAASFHDPSYADQVVSTILSEFPESRDWERLEAIICRFFWTDKTILNWKHCWESAMEGRRRNVVASVSTPVDRQVHGGSFFINEEEDPE